MSHRPQALRLTLLAALAAAPAAAAPPQELVFTAVAPCRQVDTRTSGGALAPGVPRSIHFRGRCGVPGLTSDGGVEANQAVALALNVVAVSPAGPGHLVAWPSNRPAPETSVINYNAASQLNVANGVIVAMCDELAEPPCASGDISFLAGVSATHLIVDVVGYFRKPVRPGAKRYGAGAGSDSFLCVNSSQSIKFGLSHRVASWELAELACPAGTWVCSGTERGLGSCNTTRPDTTSCDHVDYQGDCVDMPADQHFGWTRSANDTLQSDTYGGSAIREDGARYHLPISAHLPVWCCSSW